MRVLDRRYSPTELEARVAVDLIIRGPWRAKWNLTAVAWSRIVGDRLDTSEVARMLGVTRQALAKRQRSGSLLGLRGRATTWFPVWQFDTRERCVRPVTADVIAAFREHLGDVDPVLVASWATTAQDEDLGGATPSEWIESRPDHRRLIESAHRAAARLAQ